MQSTKEKAKQYIENIKKDNKQGRKINALLELREKEELLKEAEEIDKKLEKGQATGTLAGKIIAVKSNINVSGLNISCASKTLEDYKATYDATVIEKIKKEDGLIIGICNMDEFACGSSGESSAFGVCQNPQAPGLIPGGSSSGSAAAVSAGFCDMALGSDTAGSIRNPASHCSMVGVKPTYSSVSRYGLIDLSMSLDQIGPLTKDVYSAGLLLNTIKGKDNKDSVSQESKKINLKNIEKIPKNLTVGVLDLEDLEIDENIKELIDNKVKEKAKELGWEIKKIKIPHIDLGISTYYPLMYVEFFSATRRFDGRKYGKKIEDVAGEEVLRRILGGSEISKAEHAGRYYHKALKIKQYLEKQFSKAFEGNEVDCIISPTVPKLPHKLGEEISVEKMYAYDSLTVPSNLAGNCSISVPVGSINKNRLDVPVGLQVICDKFQEEKMLQIARAFEDSNH